MANFRSLTVIWMACIFSSIALAQERSIDSTEISHPFDDMEQGWWNISLHGGFSFLTADVEPEIFKGSGIGIALGRNLFYEKESMLTADLRIRFQYGIVQGLSTDKFEGIQNNSALNGSRLNLDGLNYAQNPGFIYQNYRSSILQTAFEIPIYLNPARMNNRLHLGVFAGLGIGWYHADIDQLDAGGGAYDYANDEAFDLEDLSDDAARDALNSAWDGDFETNADGFDEEFLKITIMPSFGAEIGVLAKNNIILGLGHRFSLTRTDLLDGSQWIADNTESEDMDFLHFSHLFIKWNIPTAQRKSYPPNIEKISPLVNEVNTREPLAVIRTRLNNVKSVNDISILHNGLPYNVLQYYQKELATNVPLVEGPNEIMITVSNSDGSDQERYLFNYLPSRRTDDRKEKAEIAFINPAVEGQTIAGTNLELEAEVFGVKSEQEVRLFLNQIEIKNFSFDPASSKLNAELNLQAGKNDIKILALNRNGISQMLRTVVADTSGSLVNIDILEPEERNFNTSSSYFDLRYFISGTDPENSELIVNGEQFNFSVNELETVISERIALEQGSNIIRIKAQNDSEMAEEKIVVRRIISDDKEPKTDVITQAKDAFIIEDYIKPLWSSEEEYCLYNMELSYPSSVESGDIEIKLNNEIVQRLRIFEEDRLVRSELKLNPGRNFIKVRDLGNKVPVYDKMIVCTDENGVEVEDENELESVEEVEIESTIDLPVQKEDVAPPPSGSAPVIAMLSPREAESEISSPEIQLKARVDHVTRKENLSLYFNDEIVPNFDFDAEQGLLTASLNPRADQNQITLIAINEFGVADEVRYIIYKPVPPPDIAISTPTNQERFFRKEVVLKATVSGAPKEKIQLGLNGEKVNNWELSDGQLTALLSLKEGVNRIELSAENKTAQRTKTLYINYQVLRAPEVLIISPENDTRVIAEKYPMVANVKHVDSRDQIQVFLNDNPVSDFNYTSGTISKELVLREGSNTLRIVANNPQGKASDKKQIEYHVPKPPQIVAIKPAANRIQTKTKPYPLKLQLKHVYARSQIKLKLNGQQKQDFVLDSMSSELTASLDLKEGVNEIVIEVQNEDGGDAHSMLIEYVAPRPPEIVLIQPKTDLNTESEKLDFTASISNVQSPGDITLLLNGKLQTFELNNAILTAGLQLSEGTNDLVLTAKNEDGTDKKAVQLEYTKPLPPPVIELKQPRESGIIVNEAEFDLAAELLHIKGSYTVVLALNGKQVPYDFNPSSGKMTARLKLMEGANEIDLKVENSSGTAKSQSTINYKKPEDAREKKPRIQLVQLSEIKTSSYDSLRGTASIVLLIEKIETKNQLSLTLNGQDVKNFVFEPRTGKLICPLKLRKGSNALDLKATNPYGTESYNKVIEF